MKSDWIAIALIIFFSVLFVFGDGIIWKKHKGDRRKKEPDRRNGEPDRRKRGRRVENERGINRRVENERGD